MHGANTRCMHRNCNARTYSIGVHIAFLVSYDMSSWWFSTIPKWMVPAFLTKMSKMYCVPKKLTTPWACYQISKMAVCACTGNAGNIFPHHRLQTNPLVSGSGMHHGTCLTHVPWCLSGLLTREGREKRPMEVYVVGMVDGPGKHVWYCK